MDYIALGDLISKAQVEKCGKREYPVLSMTMHDGIVFQNDRFKKDIASIDRSNYSVVGFNQLVVSFPIDEGVLAVQDITDAGIVSPAYKIWDIDQAKLVPKYLEMWLRSPRSIDYYKSKLRGTTARRRSIPEEDFLGMRVNVPPKEEQERIVDLLTRVKGVMLLREQELVALDDLIKARFVEMFGDPEIGVCKYPLCRLGDLAIKISDGVHAKPEYTEEGKPFLSVVNINKGVVDFTDCKYVSEEAYQKMIKSTHPEYGDVLYTKVGATYGIPAYVDTDKEFCLYVSVCLIKPIHDRINSRFLAVQMAMPFIKHQADSRIKGIGVPDLHLNQISEFNIICPPRAEQDAFVAFVDQIDKSKSAIQKSLDETQLLFDSLMQKYFG